MAMEFARGSIEGEKEFDGKVFPLTLLPPAGTESPPNKAAMLEVMKRESHRLAEAMKEHRAILLRGFGLSTVEDFSALLEALGWEEFPYEGAAARKMLADRIYTASEAPLHLFIPFHHEMALIKRSPPKVFFYCVQPASEGGETAVSASDIVVRRMEETVPEVVERLEREGMRFVIHTKTVHKELNDNPDGKPSFVWQRMLKTTDEVEGEKRALETLSCNSVKFNSDGTADFSYGPMNPIRNLEGRRVWWNTIIGYSYEERDAYACFDDGVPLPSEATEAFDRFLEESSVNVKWETGDVLMVNNYAAQHARRSGKPPRTVVVSLTV